MTFSLPKKTLILWQIRLFLTAPLLFSVIFAFFGISYSAFLSAVILSVIYIIVCVFLFFYYKSHKITLNSNSVAVEKGIIIKRTYIMPSIRIIFTRSISTPLSKAFGLTAMSLKNVGTGIFIPELESDKVDIIRKELSGGENNEN